MFPKSQLCLKITRAELTVQETFRMVVFPELEFPATARRKDHDGANSLPCLELDKKFVCLGQVRQSLCATERLGNYNVEIIDVLDANHEIFG
ncbi:hypothetical protein RCL_jg573.t1 [Rhizophagus clarus]|uniref:Uncharacterized protein n=1 Tax=Rhizophagus clarus TaxID=94130 RepID=A0A8H3QRQ9_9GLOM|nr:hypothetical protein RCL_jg573.t1 [Rhizophagus clarus]